MNCQQIDETRYGKHLNYEGQIDAHTIPFKIKANSFALYLLVFISETSWWNDSGSFNLAGTSSVLTWLRILTKSLTNLCCISKTSRSYEEKISTGSKPKLIKWKYHSMSKQDYLPPNHQLYQEMLVPAVYQNNLKSEKNLILYQD